jgi:hypothetical protein
MVATRAKVAWCSSSATSSSPAGRISRFCSHHPRVCRPVIVMAMLPVLAAYIIFQRQVVSGLTAGALK